MWLKRPSLLAIGLLIVLASVSGQNQRRFRNRRGRTTRASPVTSGTGASPVPSGTQFRAPGPFRCFSRICRSPPPLPQTRVVTTPTVRTSPPSPSTTTPAATTTVNVPPPSPRPPNAPAMDAPVKKPLDSGIAGAVVPEGLRNLGQATGSRTEMPGTSPNTTRPQTLKKTGSLRNKMTGESNLPRAADSGFDQPINNNDDSLLENLFTDEPLKFNKPRNVRFSSMPGPPEPLDRNIVNSSSSGQRRLGADIGSDAPAAGAFRGRRVDSIGREFWIAFMDNRVERPVNQPLEIYVAAGHYANGVKATVRMWYYNPYGRREEVFDVTELNSDSVKILTVPAYMRNVVNGIFKKGIRVVSSHPITVVGFNYERYSADAFRVIPLDALSSHYIAVTYGQPRVRTQLGCLAVRDDTLIRVNLPHKQAAGVTESVVDIEGLRFNAGETFNLTLNAFEVLSLRSVGDLTGAEILASDKVACFSGNVRAHVDVGSIGWSRDHLISQLLPVSTWEREFVIAPAPSGLTGASLGETHIFVSSQPDTVIQITETGKAPVVLSIAKARGKAFIKNLDDFAHVRSDKPIQIAQVFGSQQGRDSPVTGDPSMIIYSGISQYSSHPQTTLPPEGHFGYVNKVLVIINRDQRSGLRMNRRTGRNVEIIGWRRIPNTNLVARYISVDDDRLTQIYHIDNRVPFYVQYYGFSDRESYTYGGATTMILGCDHTPAVAGDGIDNDCDGFTDEEIIDRFDNDNDGLIDEDTGHRRPYELVGGKEYVLTFMENAAEQRGEQIHLYVSVAPDETASSATITVSQPRLAGGFSPITRFVTKNEFQLIAIPPATATIYGTTKSNRAIKVVASHRVVIYALNQKKYSMDGNLLYPVDRLGTEYYTVSYSPSHVATQFAIVATEPGTVVEITFPPEVVNKPWADGRIQVPWNGLMWTNNHQLTVNLQENEAVQMQSGYELPTTFDNRYKRGDLTGTYIKSNKPIAVFSGNGRVNTRPSNSRDHLVEQMPPVSSWGKEYIVIPTPQRTVGEYYRIIASEPNTNVIVDRSDGVYETFKLDKGEFNQINIRTGGVSASIYADKPVLVVMFMKSQGSSQQANTEPGDPAMIVIPHRHQWMYSVHFGTPIATYQDFYVTVVIQKDYRSGLRLNGVAVQLSQYRDAPMLGSTSFSYIVLTVVQGTNYHLTHDNPTASFFAQIYGTKDRESVGYIMGINLPIENQKYVYYPEDPEIPGGFTTDPFDIYTVELCNDGIDNDGDFLIDEDCDHVHEYYAMFMTNTVPNAMDHSLEIHCVSTSNQNYVRLTTGHINRRIARHEVEKNIIQEVTLNRDETMLFTVPGHYRAQLSRSGYFDTQYKGVVVESDWALECFAFNKDTGSADGWLMKDYYDLGTRYVVSAAHPYANHQLIGLVGTDDNTVVSITLPTNADPNLFYTYVDVQGFRYYAGETFNITLNRLQIFQLDVQNGFDLTGTFIQSNRPVAVFAGNERSAIPYEAFTGWDHAADQIPKIASSVDLDPNIGSSYRYDVLPTPTNQLYDTYQCVGWSADTVVTFKQNGISLASLPLGFAGVVKNELPTSSGPVQIFSNNPLMCEQFTWSDSSRPGNSPELAANILANTFYDSRPWFRFVVPKTSTLSAVYSAHLVVSFNLEQLFQNESPAFFLDGTWVDNVAVTVVGDQAFFTITDLGYGPHAISSAIVDSTDNSIKKVLLRFNIQLFLHAGTESIAYSPVPEQLYTV